MKKFSRLVVKGRYIILVIAFLLLIPSVFGYLHTRVNYDILTYLPKQIDTMKGQEILKDEFGTGGYSLVEVEGMQNKDIQKLADKIEKVDHVNNVIWYGSLADLSIPVELLPDGVQKDFVNGDAKLMFVTYDTGMSSDESMEAVTKIRSIATKSTYVAGLTATVEDTKELAEREEPIYVLIAVVLAVIVLSLTMDSWVVPFLFLLSIGMAIIYNLGTNMFLGDISYVTKALAAILQLGVTMDYSIFLWHSFTEQMDLNGHNDEIAMEKAIQMTFTSVIGSSVTTIAGFIALCFMSFTLGMDLGIVMAKGVLLGVISCLTILPALIMVTGKLTAKTSHKPLLPEFRITKFVMKHYKLILVIFCVMWIPALFGYNHMSVYYKLDSSLPDNLPGVEANAKLDKDFNLGTVDIAIIDSNLSAKDGSAMAQEMEDVDGVNNVLSLDSVIGPAMVKDVLPQDLLKEVKTDKYQMMLVGTSYQVATDEMNEQCDELESIIKKYDPNGMLIGEGPCNRDLIRITASDFARVSSVSIGLVFLIIIFDFGSALLPVILILTIEFAVYFNLGIPYYMGTTLPFIASIVIGTVQLGSTVDYAILMTSRYKLERISGKGKEEAITIAHRTSVRSIFVSALSFFASTIGVSIYSNIDMIGSLCTLLSRGAIISMITVLTVLPAMLMVFDPLICRTTKGMRVCLADSGRKGRHHHKEEYGGAKDGILGTSREGSTKASDQETPQGNAPGSGAEASGQQSTGTPEHPQHTAGASKDTLVPPGQAGDTDEAGRGNGADRPHTGGQE